MAAMDNKSRFLGLIPDLCMADRQQVELFDAIGCLRGPFQNVRDWPWIDDKLREASAAYLERVGRERWEKTTGGLYDEQGRPYCRMSSELATSVVRNMADKIGGLLWQDHHGTGWAVKLGRMPRWDRDARYGFAISWGGQPPVVRPGDAGNDLLDRDAGRRYFLRAGAGLRLFRRAEQLLWAIRATVLQKSFPH